LSGVPNVAASTDFDEIRFGSTWKDVVASAPHPAKYKFTTIDYPGATITAANNIDGAGRIVGEYEDPSGHHAFILDDGVYSSFDVPGAFGASSANGLNAADQVVGWYDGFVTTKAYIRNGATYTDLNPFAGAPDVKAYAINEAGHVAGYYERPTDGLYRGYVYDGTNYTTLNYPGAVGSQAIGINKDDDVVGYYFSGQPHGFLYEDGAYTTVDHPNGGFGTVAQGINDAGEIAGIYFDSNNRDHGFIKTSTGFVTVDYPGAALTGLTAINNAGQVVGYYGDGVNPFRAFVATPLAAADFNGDDKVDGADLARWKSGLGTASGASKRDGDADGDGDVDGGDFLVWQRLVTSAPIAASAEAAVPEPASIALAVGGLTLAVARRRRESRRQG
jgi:uncharacterized membrane protein